MCSVLEQSTRVYILLQNINPVRVKTKGKISASLREEADLEEIAAEKMLPW